MPPLLAAAGVGEVAVISGQVRSGPCGALDTLGSDNGALFRQDLLWPSAAGSVRGSRVHSAPALVSGFHLTPTLWTPL